MKNLANIATIQPMPTPVGHALAGFATAWFADAVRERRTRRFGTLTAACVTAAVIPDIDILFRTHRTYTHSVGAALVAGALAMLVARRRSHWMKADCINPRGVPPALIGLIVATAYATHILLDWLAKDTAPPLGLMALWPFSTQFYLSHADIFLEVSRRYWKPSEFVLGNLISVGWETILLGPIVALAWMLCRRADRNQERLQPRQ